MCKERWQAGGPGKSWGCDLNPKTVCWAFLPLEGGESWVIFRPSIQLDWMGPTCIIESNLLYSKSNDLNVNSIQNIFTGISWITFNQTAGTAVLSSRHIKLTITIGMYLESSAVLSFFVWKMSLQDSSFLSLDYVACNIMYYIISM